MESIRKSLLFYGGQNNSNGHHYDKESISAAVMQKFLERVASGQAMGELGHSADSIVSLTKISHIIAQVDNRDDCMDCLVKPLDTEQGRVLADMDPESWVLRPRFIGVVDDNGRVTVQDIVSFDAVPAGDDAWLERELEYRKNFGNNIDGRE